MYQSAYVCNFWFKIAYKSGSKESFLLYLAYKSPLFPIYIGCKSRPKRNQRQWLGKSLGRKHEVALLSKWKWWMGLRQLVICNSEGIIMYYILLKTEWLDNAILELWLA